MLRVASRSEEQSVRNQTTDAGEDSGIKADLCLRGWGVREPSHCGNQYEDSLKQTNKKQQPAGTDLEESIVETSPLFFFFKH